MIVILLFLTLILITGCGRSSSSEPAEEQPIDAEKEEEAEFVILSTTDMHGKCWDTNVLTGSTDGQNMLRVKTAVNSIRADFGEDRVLLIDNGDLYQGTPVSSVQLNQYSQGLSREPLAMAVCVADVGYTATGIGNHEFNYPWQTMEDARAYLSANGIPTICANIYDEKTGENAFTPYIIKDIPVGDRTLKIGILGLGSTDCPRWDVPENYPGLMFHHPDNPGLSIAREAERYVPAMKAEGCDLIVVAFHGGIGSVEGELVYGKNTSDQAARMIAETEGIDMVIAGHDHSAGYSNTYVQNKNGQDVLIVNGGGGQLTKTVFSLTADESGFALSVKSTENLSLWDYAPDEALQAKIRPYADLTVNYVNQIAGRCLGDWDDEVDFFLRQSDSMDLIQAAQIYTASKYVAQKYDTPEKQQALFAETGLDHLDVDLSSSGVPINGDYHVREGDVTMRDVYQLYRFDNTLYVVPMTGAEIKAVLEQNAATRFKATVGNGSVIYSTMGDNYSNPVFGGLNFRYDLYRREGDRVLIDGFSNGRGFESEKTYLVAVNNYHLGNNGCGFGSFTTSDAIWSQTDDLGGGTIPDLLMEYLSTMTAEKGGVKASDFNWHWRLSYSGDLYADQPLTGSIIGKKVTALRDGQRILIYSPSECLVVASEPAENQMRLSGVPAAVSGDRLGTDAPAAIFTVVETPGSDGYYAFRADSGGYLTAGETGNSLGYQEELSGLGMWLPNEVEGGFHLINKDASYDGKNDQAMQWYSGFTTYQEKSTAVYLFELYEVE